MREDILAFIEIITTITKKGITLYALYLLPYLTIVLLHILFVPFQIINSAVMIIVIIFCAVLILPRIKFEIFWDGIIARELAIIFTNKFKRKYIKMCWKDKLENPQTYNGTWFVSVSHNSVFVLNSNNIDFKTVIIHKECIYREDLFRMQAFCESWTYHTFILTNHTGETESINMIRVYDFYEWIKRNKGRIKSA